ncbi:MAG: antibiotic biosynthesis monooxygenase [Deltaproteobacteria bacterium]|nr:antibiotic biosynthesis monooxygenase [Deltaproteobacteria bacterium]
MIVCIMKITPEPDQRQAVLDLLQSVKGPTAVKSGCTECSVFEEFGHEGRIIYIEQWSSHKALKEHIVSTIYSRVLSAMEFASEAPEIYFHEVSSTYGMDFIMSLRANIPA